MWRHLPNALCILRMLLVVPIAWALTRGDALLALLLFAVAAFTDGLDGFLAKRCGWESALGKILDPLADKLLLVTVFLTLGILGLVPLWLALAAVLRDVVITAGALTYKALYGDPEGHPTGVSKVNTMLQLLYVLLVVGSAAGATPLQSGPALAALEALGAAGFVTTVVSGLDYVITYARKARRAHLARHAGRGAATGR